MSGKIRDLIGRRFGSLTVIGEAGRAKNGNVLWNCFCDCGREHIAAGGHIRSGHTKTCGHCYENTYRLSENGSYMIGSLRDGFKFLIDIDDYQRVSAHTWHRSGESYAETCINGKLIFLHRFITNCPHGMYIDHINRDRSDNRKSNLRFATIKENNRNVGLQSNNTSGAKGVHYTHRLNKYIAYITVDGKRIHLGCYNSKYEAAKDYNQAALRYFGEFAWLNDLRKITPRPVSFLLPCKEKIYQDAAK